MYSASIKKKIMSSVTRDVPQRANERGCVSPCTTPQWVLSIDTHLLDSRVVIGGYREGDWKAVT